MRLSLRIALAVIFICGVASANATEAQARLAAREIIRTRMKLDSLPYATRMEHLEAELSAYRPKVFEGHPSGTIFFYEIDVAGCEPLTRNICTIVLDADLRWNVAVSELS